MQICYVQLIQHAELLQLILWHIPIQTNHLTAFKTKPSDQESFIAKPNTVVDRTVCDLVNKPIRVCQTNTLLQSPFCTTDLLSEDINKHKTKDYISQTQTKPPNNSGTRQRVGVTWHWGHLEQRLLYKHDMERVQW